MALDGKASLGISLNHRQEFDVEKVQVALDQASKQMNTYKEAAEFIGSKRYTEDTLFQYFNRVFPYDNEAKQKTVSFRRVNELL